MALRKYVPPCDASSAGMKPLSFSGRVNMNAQVTDPDQQKKMERDMDVDLKEVYFLIMHFLSAGPCHRTYGQFWNELLEHQLLPRRYHSWYSRTGSPSGDENDDGMSLPLSYNNLIERYPHIANDHLVKLLKQLLVSTASLSEGVDSGRAPTAADVPTLLGRGSFSLLKESDDDIKHPPPYMRWPHKQADQVRGLSLREIGGGFSRHHRSPSVRAACYAIAKPSTMVQKMQNIKKIRGHRNAVYCAIFDRTGRYVITGSDDRLVKIWSMETAYCLASCRGHEGDITDLAVSSNNALVASSSNDCIIRVWRLADGLPISVLRGHTGAVTAITFSPRPASVYQLLSSSDDGTCRLWDARNSQFSPRIFVPKPPDTVAGRNGAPVSNAVTQNHQIFCCAFNANGTVFVTGSSDNLARVWNACKPNKDESDQPNYEMDVLSGHENDVNYVQFSGCAAASRFSVTDTLKEESVSKFKNSWYSHDNIVTCSRDGSAIIWTPRSRRSHGRVGRWCRAYHLKVPPPPMPPQPSRGGPRQRILPTPRGVNMIIWSLDNRFVLAAIMDCRICVWNASDGSLVHSLTGHTDSTYVLDVHPFNPRIAMSAGYDGKTIVWDIWEGKPIRIYEISRFKLVDGKFSPDGTSITLSDDVGQLYILSTGQGESQNDAKYDQFFLGDYRPLIQDTYGNVLDQETQLAPYRRNMQDLLCDSGMTPYEEPYQSRYQKRRLGALGIEWRPSSLRLAIGPDLSLDPDFQMLPLADLDVVIEPIPEFMDVMEWEPENPVQSDDNDSEYNITEEYSSRGEQGSLDFDSSDNSECGAEDSGGGDSNKDIRRSKRRKQKPEVEIMTSSGRRVKRRNLDEHEGDSLRSNRSRKQKNGTRKKKSSKSKALRPQRAAARNALSLFSRITGASTGEEEELSESDVSDSESNERDSDIQSDDSEEPLQNEQIKLSKGKEVYKDLSREVAANREHHDTPITDGNKRRLILKLPVRDSNRLAPFPRREHTSDSRCNFVGSSSEIPRDITEGSSIRINEHNPQSFANTSCKTVEKERKEIESNVDQIKLGLAYQNGKIKWGGARARSVKRPRLGEIASAVPCGQISSQLEGHDRSENKENGILKLERLSEVQDDRAKTNEEATCMNLRSFDNGTCENLGGAVNDLEHPKVIKCSVDDDSIEEVCVPSEDRSPAPAVEGADQLCDIDPLKPFSSEVKNSSGVMTDSADATKQELRNLTNDCKSGLHDETCENHSCMEQDIAQVPAHDQNKRISLAKGDNGLLGSDNNNDISGSTLPNSNLHSNANRIFSAVYRRSKSTRTRTNLEGEASGVGESTSNANTDNIDAQIELQRGSPDLLHKTQSMGLKMSLRKCDAKTGIGDMELDHEHESEDPSQGSESNHISRCELPHEEWGSSSKATVGLRSTRNRRASFHLRDTSPPIEKRKSTQSSRKGSWLLLTSHEDGSRYIPQQGDEVVYLRQGHEEFIDCGGSKERGPWTVIKGNVGPVEFCKVESLEYAIYPGSGESCCRMMLRFIDPASGVFRKSFKLTLPEATGFPDFLVERTRFEATTQRNWTVRDKCRVWWKNDGEDDGSWWEGRIVSVNPKSPEFPDSPWERYTIQYKSDPREKHRHSPWELFDTDTQWEQLCIDDEIRNKLLSAINKLEKSGNYNQDRYGIQKLTQVSQKSSFINRFPVPLTLELIKARLENNYYRSIETVKHDIGVLVSNAETYFGKSPELSSKMRRLSEWFARTLSSL